MGIVTSLLGLNPKKFKDVDYIIQNAKHGDFILLSGRGSNSNCIRIMSDETYWSHVLIVVEDKTTGKKYAAESNLDSRQYDELTKKVKDGVRLITLKDKLYKYDGYVVAWRRLVVDDRERYGRMYSAIWRVIRQEIPKEYTRDLIELYRSIKGTNEEEMNQTFFCTKFVAHIYIEIGLISHIKLDNNYALRHFTSKEKLPFLDKRHRFEDEIFARIVNR